MQNTEYEVIIKRIDQLEKGLLDIRQQIEKLLNAQKEPKKRFKSGEEVMAFFASDKQENTKIIERVFEEIGITGKPIPAEELQKRMAKNGIRAEDNEFSRTIIQEREN